MTEVKNKPTIYRVITALGFLLVVILNFTLPYNMCKEPDAWAYYYAVENFSQGKLVVNDQLHSQQAGEAAQQGGGLVQYVKVADNQWALEKAPGYIFFLVPFHLLDIPRMANVFLALGMVLVTYLLLKRLRNEKTACIGSLLMLFTQVSIIMLQRSYMAMFGASSFLVIGGGLYIYYCLESSRLKPWVAYLLLFLATLLIGWSVVARYTNILIALVFALHFIITRLQLSFGGQKRPAAVETIPFCIGAGLSVMVLLLYNNAVFGSLWDTGYNYSNFPVKFAFQYIGAVGPDGGSIPMGIIRDNLRNMPIPLLFGFPLLLIAIPGVGFILYQKIVPLIRRRNNTNEKPDPWLELPWDVLLLLIGWIICVFPLYISYEWTASLGRGDLPFIVYDRFYLPALFPIVIITSLLITRFRSKLMVTTMAILVVAGSVLFAQYTTTVDELWRDKDVTQPARPQVQRQPWPTPPQIQMIEQTRQEVKTTPTNEDNMHERFSILTLWSWQLGRDGYPVKQVLPPYQLLQISKLIKSGNINDAAFLIDRAYQKLEEMVAG